VSSSPRPASRCFGVADCIKLQYKLCVFLFFVGTGWTFVREAVQTPADREFQALQRATGWIGGGLVKADLPLREPSNTIGDHGMKQFGSHQSGILNKNIRGQLMSAGSGDSLHPPGNGLQHRRELHGGPGSWPVAQLSTWLCRGNGATGLVVVVQVDKGPGTKWNTVWGPSFRVCVKVRNRNRNL